GTDHRAEVGDALRVRRARDRHRIARGAGGAADAAHRAAHRAPQDAQARPPLAPRAAAAGRPPPASAQVRRLRRRGPLPLAHRAAGAASL
ncbi:MAG: SSU ribosomal protein S15p (S13e), partial [uncultured Actinomycetospora sp.]